jgi:tetratricopeptide (TPR) repeat protein
MAKLPDMDPIAPAAVPMGRPNASDQARAAPIADPTTVPGYRDAVTLFDQATARYQGGDHAGAAMLFREVVGRMPGMVAAHNNLGVALLLDGQTDAAAAAFRRAIEIAPDYVMPYANLGRILREQGQLEQAVDLLRRAVTLDPGSAEFQNQLGSLYSALDRPALAAAHFRRATEIKPDFAIAHSNLGMALSDMNRWDDAIAAYQQAAALDPDDASIQVNLAFARDDPGGIAEAEAQCRRLIATLPSSPEAHNALGLTLQKQNRLEESLASYLKAIALRPDFVPAVINASLALLLLGRYDEAWPKYEWRRRLAMLNRNQRSQPQWQGHDIADKTILLHSEQGFGDTIQFLRYVPLVAERARHVVLEVPRQLVRMAASLPVDTMTIVPNDRPPPSADVHSPLLGLPRIFGTRVDSIPGRVPYLMPRPSLVERWARTLGADPRLKVGLAWAGNPEHKGNRSRSLTLSRLAPLLAVDGVVFHSLQVGAPVGDLAGLPQGAVIDLSTRLTDFAETAGAILNLDLLIAVDTAVVHLAGALARPAWVMVAFSPDWRWLIGRDDSPWYPSVRIYRQPVPGDWDGVIARVAGDLARLVADRATGEPR